MTLSVSVETIGKVILIRRYYGSTDVRSIRLASMWSIVGLSMITVGLYASNAHLFPLPAVFLTGPALASGIADRPGPESQVRTRLPAGAKGIRTVGPSRENVA